MNKPKCDRDYTKMCIFCGSTDNESTEITKDDNDWAYRQCVTGKGCGKNDK